MTTKPEPYTIFNDGFSLEPRAGRHTTFGQFCRLPAEIRTQIWTECIPAHRFIRICLDNDMTEEFPNLYTTKNHLGNTVSGCPYRMRAAGSEEWSPDILTRVSHEASKAFRSVCRVRIPLPVPGGDGSVKLLYISPDTDVVWVTCEQNTLAVPVLVAFLHDLVAYDPRGIGIVHLAIGGNPNDAQALAELDPSHLHPAARQSFTKLLSSSLQTFHPVVFPNTEGRTMLGYMSWPHAQFHHNRSVPIIPCTESYTRLKCDPRAVKADLTHVAANTDPRRTTFLWNRFKANFGETRHIKIRYIVGIMPYNNPPIRNRARFVDLLQVVDDRWAEWTAFLGQQVWGERMSKEEYEAQRTSLPQAAGMWCFPEEAFGDVPEVEEMGYMDIVEWEPKLVKDLSEFEPELWVFNLP